MSNKRNTESNIQKHGVDDVARVVLSVMNLDPDADIKDLLLYRDCFVDVFNSDKLCEGVFSRYAVDLGWFFEFRQGSVLRDVSLFVYCKALALELNGYGQITLERIKGEVMNFVKIPYEECYDNMYIYGELSFSELDILQFTCYLEDKYGVSMPEDINSEMTKNTKDISLSEFSRLICQKINSKKH